MKDTFELRQDVRLAALPKPGGAALPPGDYFVKVTSPGGLVLGSSAGSLVPAPVHVRDDGTFESCIPLWDLTVYGSAHLTGFEASPNPDGVYKAWLSRSPSFEPSDSFSTVFRVVWVYAVDPTIAPGAPLVGLSGGPERPLAAVLTSSGARITFVANEVIYEPHDPSELAAFVARYNGTILRDGSPFIVPGLATRVSPELNAGPHLVRVDVSASSVDDITSNMVATGAPGGVTFSSEDAVRLAALVARERRAGLALGPNGLVTPTTPEHPTADGGNLDTEDVRLFWHLAEDGFPDIPGDQGLSTGVVRAWEYLRYKGVPPSSGTWSPPVLAIVDFGFDLDGVRSRKGARVTATQVADPRALVRSRMTSNGHDLAVGDLLGLRRREEAHRGEGPA